MAEIGFIGMGNMGYALMKGILKTRPAREVVFTDKLDATKIRVHEETSVKCTATNCECVEDCKYLVLAIKPQYYDEVLSEIKDAVTSGHVVISIAPGITIDSVNTRLGGGKRVVRVMPNTPALIGEGMTGISFDKEQFTQEEIDTVHGIFASVGRYSDVEERMMNAVVCVSGSSPAYVYQFIEALADSAVQFGLPRNEAYIFAAQSVMGSAKMVLETGEHPAVLKDRVCSPGGTTMAAVAALENAGFRSAVFKAGEACYNKAEEMGK